MAIENLEKALTLREAARSLPKIEGKPVAPYLLKRWSERGVRSRQGIRVHLELFRVGGRWLVFPEKLAAFLEKLNANDAEPEKVEMRTPAQIDRACERAEEELTAAGI
jgi:hypothetical protein